MALINNKPVTAAALLHGGKPGAFTSEPEPALSPLDEPLEAAVTGALAFTSEPEPAPPAVVADMEWVEALMLVAPDSVLCGVPVLVGVAVTGPMHALDWALVKAMG